MITNKPSRQNINKIGRRGMLYKPYGLGQVEPPPVILQPPVYLGGFAPPAGQVGIAYNHDLAQYFTGAESFAADVLPTGLSVVGSAITGTPTGAESPVVTITATNPDGSTPTDPATLTITL